MTNIAIESERPVPEAPLPAPAKATHNTGLGAALASEASGQRGDSIVRAPDTRPEPGSSARAALASEASGQRGNSIVRAHSASEDARERAIAFLWDRIVARKLAADCEQQTRAFVAAAQERPTEQRA
jgi:hypothetical protein